MTYVLPLDDCRTYLAEVVGGKAVGLGSLVRQGLRVPHGFAVGTHAYREFISETGLGHAIHELLAGVDSVEAQADASRRIAALFEEHELLPSCRDELVRAYVELGQPPVAVRSSAISEDAAGASFAGEHETFLWIHGANAVARAVLGCWASLFTPQALAYFQHVQVHPDETSMGVIVQTMVGAEAAGVMITIDPITGDRSQIAIEGSFGLGQAVVSGEVTPDRWAVDKVLLEIRSQVLSRKHLAYGFDPNEGEVRRMAVPEDEQERPCLSDNEVVEIAALGKRVECALGAPQDIEWALGSGREVYLLQTRPETVWSQKNLQATSPGARSRSMREAGRPLHPSDGTSS